MGSDSKVQETLSIKECYEQLYQEASMNIYSAIIGQQVFCI